jgi:hypothetical protein
MSKECTGRLVMRKVKGMLTVWGEVLKEVRRLTVKTEHYRFLDG